MSRDRSSADKLSKKFCFAGITVKVICQYETVFRYCAHYESTQFPRYSITITDKNIAEERKRGTGNGIKEYYEIPALLRNFCNISVADNTLLFHSSAVMVDGKAYLFAAPSGTGKSTHARLWREMMGDRMTMINDDKPFIRWQNGEFIVYGSPWNGKHHLDNNISAPLAGICFLSQGKENKIRLLSEPERLPLLLQQTYRPESEEGTKNMLRLLVEMAGQIPMWHLDCTISREAAELSYNTMRSMSL